VEIFGRSETGRLATSAVEAKKRKGSRSGSSSDPTLDSCISSERTASDKGKHPFLGLKKKLNLCGSRGSTGPTYIQEWRVWKGKRNVVDPMGARL